jgi:hypothetical protein
MERDFDLIRDILQEVQAAPAMTPLTKFHVDGYEDNVVNEHIELLIEAGFLEGKIYKFAGGGSEAIVNRLTWTGHDFLDAMKDDSIWIKAKETILKPVGGIAFEVLLEWLKWQMREKLGLPPAV